MTRPVQHSLALLLVAAPLVFMGCGNSSSSNTDATPPKDSKSGPDVANVPKLDASPDLAPVTPPDGAVVPPDVAAPDAPADTLLPPVDVGPAGTLDAAADKFSTTVDLGPLGNPDVPADQSPAAVEAGPVITPDAVAGSSLDSGEAGPVAAIDANTDAAAPDGALLPDSSGAATDSSPVACGTFVGGPVVSDLRLTKVCSPYIISIQIQVNAGAVLTIDPGVTLMFSEVVGIDVGSHDDGKLVAVGTAADPIVFTSNSSPPLPGDWANITLLSGTMAGTKIAYAKLDYCGSDRNGCIVAYGLTANLVTLDNLAIGRVGLDANGIVEYDAESNFAITNSTFNDIGDGKFAISVQAPSFAGIGASNTFNGSAMIELFGGTVTATTSWSDPGTAIAVTDSLFVDGTDNPVLTLGPGITLKFAPRIPALEFGIGYSTGGKLIAAGTSADRVVITSLADVPNQGDWVGVEVWSNGAAQISYANISYAGSDASGGGNIILESANSSASLAVDHTALAYGLGYGIYLACADTTVSTPLATVTLGAGNTYAFNDMDLSLTNDQANNVGPGLTCPAL